MSRPLIIKVESHKTQPSRRATGSIDVNFIKGFDTLTTYQNFNSEIDGTPSFAYEEPKTPIEQGVSRSIVRSLISRYETFPEKASLIKYKSKSLADLKKPITSTPIQKTQDDYLYFNGKYNSNGVEGQDFDFKKAFTKFHDLEQTTTNTTVHHTKYYKSFNHQDNPLDVVTIKQQAKILLQQYQEHDYSSWQDRVIELLKSLSTLRDCTNSGKPNQEAGASFTNKPQKPAVIYKEDTPSQETKMVKQSELNKTQKVKDIRSMFENSKSEKPEPVSRSISLSAKYFGVQSEDETFSPINTSIHVGRSLSATPFREDFNNNQFDDESNEDSDLSEEDWHDVDFAKQEIRFNSSARTQTASSSKVQEFKSLFESGFDKHVPNKSNDQNDASGTSYLSTYDFNNSDLENSCVVENRILPPPTIIGDGDIVDAKQQLQELNKDIENCEQQIVNLSEGDRVEGLSLNELLIKLLIKLDNVQTYGNAIIRTERRKAIQFCTNCITKLGEKVKGIK